MTEKTWFGGTGSFADAGNWSPNGVPVAGDTAVVNHGTIEINHQNLSGITLDLSPNPALGSGSPLVDVSGSILGTVNMTPPFPDAAVTQTIDVSNYAAFVGSVTSNALDAAVTINVSPRSLLLNDNKLAFVSDLSTSLDITGTRGAVVVNNGLIDVEGAADGNLKIAPALVGQGTIRVGSIGTGATEFGGLVSPGQTFDFSSFDSQAFGTVSQASLQLDMAREFFGTIANFTTIDTIDLKGVTVTSDTFKNGVLTLKDGHQTVASLRFAGSYSTSDFVTQVVGGDTLIKHA